MLAQMSCFQFCKSLRQDVSSLRKTELMSPAARLLCTAVDAALQANGDATFLEAISSLWLYPPSSTERPGRPNLYVEPSLEVIRATVGRVPLGGLPLQVTSMGELRLSVRWALVGRNMSESMHLEVRLPTPTTFTQGFASSQPTNQGWLVRHHHRHSVLPRSIMHCQWGRPSSQKLEWTIPRAPGPRPFIIATVFAKIFPAASTQEKNLFVLTEFRTCAISRTTTKCFMWTGQSSTNTVSHFFIR